MLDEPSLGLAPKIVAELFKIVRDINASGTSVLLVEQNVRQAMRIATYSYVLERGSIAAEGTGRAPAAIGHYPAVLFGHDLNRAEPIGNNFTIEKSQPAP